MAPRRRLGLALYAGSVGASAYAGAIGLATGALDLGSVINHRLPFHSPTFGAIALAIVVGLPSTAVAFQASRGDDRVDESATLAGVTLIGWIMVELAVIRELSWLQPFFAAVGATLIVIGRRGTARLEPVPERLREEVH